MSHDWYIKGGGMCGSVYGEVHVKKHLLLMDNLTGFLLDYDRMSQQMYEMFDEWRKTNKSTCSGGFFKQKITLNINFIGLFYNYFQK